MILRLGGWTVIPNVYAYWPPRDWPWWSLDRFAPLVGGRVLYFVAFGPFDFHLRFVKRSVNGIEVEET